MTDYSIDIQPRENEDQSNDIEIASVLSALTVRPILIADLENYLDFQGLASRDPVTGAWQGALIDLMQSDAVPALSAGLRKLFGHMNKPRSVHVDTASDAWAIDAYQLVQGLVMASQITAEQLDGFYELGGGMKFGVVDVVVIAAKRAEYQAVEAEELRVAELDGLLAVIANDFINPAKSDGETTASQLREAIKGWL